jgi:sortase (surface protein transpeptidase)
LPTRVRIPALDIDTPVVPIGLNSDGTLGVPQPGPHLDHAAWFENSPTPGQLGPSNVEGHVDTVDGPSVFFRLGDIRPGDHVVSDGRDGVQVTFRVDAVRDFLKTAFPTRLVYGGGRGDLGRATLRLITCSDYDPTIRHHVGNEVVFAHLVHISR